jgi:alkylation response protein AidB-like acyl-CoA dehydrogenase
MPAPTPVYIPSAFEQLISDRAKKIIQTLHDFIYDEVMPTEKLFEAQMPADRWSSIPPVVEELKKKAKALGLWNLFLHKGYKEGPGLTNLEYAIMAELTGSTRLAPEVISLVPSTNCRLRIVQPRILEIWRSLQSMERQNRRRSGLFHY